MYRFMIRAADRRRARPLRYRRRQSQRDRARTAEGRFGLMFEADDGLGR